MADRDGRRSGPRNPAPLGPGRSAAEDRQRTTILSEAMREEPRERTAGASAAGKIVGSDGCSGPEPPIGRRQRARRDWSAEPGETCHRQRDARGRRRAQRVVCGRCAPPFERAAIQRGHGAQPTSRQQSRWSGAPDMRVQATVNVSPLADPFGPSQPISDRQKDANACWHRPPIRALNHGSARGTLGVPPLIRKLVSSVAQSGKGAQGSRKMPLAAT